ncbi:MAG: DNA replication/repair protein RecF [Chloroflexi bacterium]|nr:DNA replication/repair protein RecF [Chloroflexota bacterium]
MPNFIVEKLDLYNFRNYASLEFHPSPGINFLTGENGSGKSNLIESLYSFCYSRSFRTFRDRDLITWGKDESRAALSGSGRDGRMDMSIVWRAGQDSKTLKHLLIGKSSCKRASEFVGRAPMVLFSPQDLEIVQGSPVYRRKFLDILATMLSPAHLADLSDYRQILMERNRLLSAEKPDPAQVAVWTEQLIGPGAGIIRRRLSAIKMIKEHVKGVSSRLESEKFSLAFKYLGSFPMPEDENDIENAFRKKLSETASEEKERMATLAGPHKDELLILLSGRPVRSFGSQGQQRMTSLILKLAEAELISGKTGTTPLLLLDDCLSELDEKRQKQLWGEVSLHGQVIITSGHPPPGWMKSEKMALFGVEGGSLKSLT